MTMHPYDEMILEHYRKQALAFGDSPRLAMEDDVIRAKEAEFVRNLLGSALRGRTDPVVLDAGCGNGYLLRELVESGMNARFEGLDYSPELVAIAEQRGLPRCYLQRGHVLDLPFHSDSFDAAYTVRCLINVLDRNDQELALAEIHRVLQPGALYLMIECFEEGLELNNKARVEVGLEPLTPAYHNLYLGRDRFLAAIDGKFDVVDLDTLEAPDPGYRFHRHFLSSHYFVARVLHPLVTKGSWVRNTEFVRFFSELPPYGEYSPIQAWVLRKK